MAMRESISNLFINHIETKLIEVNSKIQLLMASKNRSKRNELNKLRVIKKVILNNLNK